jgi:hypothetical protein
MTPNERESGERWGTITTKLETVTHKQRNQKMILDSIIEEARLMKSEIAGIHRSFTLKQVMMLLGSVTVMSGGGAALTVSASDQVQDNRIAHLESQLDDVVKESKETTAQVLVVQSQVEAVGDRVDDVKSDIGELRVLIIQSLQRDAH